MDILITNIKTALEKNGFPEKRVSLPFQAIFKSCKNRNVTLSSVLNALKDQDILHEMKDDRILFYPKGYQDPEKPDQKTASGIPDDLYKAAMEKLNNMDPREVEELKKKLMDMSPEEQQEMMEKAKQFFNKDNKDNL